MGGFAFITSIEFFIPLVEEREGLLSIPCFVAQVVRDAAIGVDGVEVRAQFFG